MATMNTCLFNVMAAVICAVASGCEGSSILSRNKPLYEQVIIWLESGTIEPDSSGRLTLPMNLRAASVDGEVYVSRPSTNQIIVVFKTWRGKGNNMEGFLYANPPLRKTSTQTDYYGKQVVVVGPVELTLDKQIDPNWHKVSYKLD